MFAPGGSGVIGRVLLERKSVQIPDVLNDKKPVTDALLAVMHDVAKTRIAVERVDRGRGQDDHLGPIGIKLLGENQG